MPASRPFPHRRCLTEVMRAVGLAALTTLGPMACEASLPTPAPLSYFPGGFLIGPRPACSEAVPAAVREFDGRVIGLAAREGDEFTCGLTHEGAIGATAREPVDEVTPLGRAISNLDVPLLRALLEAGADPNARWTRSGDAHPLHAAITRGPWGNPPAPDTEMVRLLPAIWCRPQCAHVPVRRARRPTRSM